MFIWISSVLPYLSFGLVVVNYRDQGVKRVNVLKNQMIHIQKRKKSFFSPDGVIVQLLSFQYIPYS